MQHVKHFLGTLRVKILLLLFAAGLAGCAQPRPLLVITVGGLGFSQMHDLRMAVKDQCPDADVVSAGMMDAYKTDIASLAQQKHYDHIILIGHSFGCEAIDNAAAKLRHVDLAVFIDPAWNDFKLSRNVGQTLWFKRSSFDIEREANIEGAAEPKTIKGGHNDIPHSPELIADVVRTINTIGVQAKAKDANPQAPARLTASAVDRGP